MFIEDLRWITGAPSLIKANDLFNDRFITFDETRLPGDFKNQINARKRKNMGAYFESLFHVACQTDPKITVLSQGKQIIHNKETIGEFDFLIEKNQKNYHLEIAVKFYLGINDCASLTDFVGPHKRDRFDLKFDRLVNRQSQLSKHEYAIPILKDLGIRHITPQVYVKGALFYPYEKYIKNDFSSLDLLDPNHVKAWWIRHKDFLSLDKNHIWSPLNKPHQFDESKIQTPMTAATILKHAKERGRSIMVARYTQNGSFIDRGFLVHDDW